ncbi:MAG: glycerol kinase GlpK [Alphaproteobacteria bacterium]
MSEQFILSLDQGTTSSRAILFDHAGNIRGVAQQEFTQIYPKPGWVEHDADEIWQCQHQVAKDVLWNTGVAAKDVAAIGITNQRETTVIWERATGKPIHNAIVWQDRRTAGLCDELKAKGLVEKFQDKTGLVLDAYFSGTKIKWLLDNVQGARQKAEAGELAFGTIDTWLIWQLTGGEVHVTDETNAARTLLFNLAEGCWDDELLTILDIPKSILPKVVTSSEVVGESRAELLGTAIKIAGIAGDQQAATMGNACTKPGMLKSTYGTGCFMVMNTGDKPQKSENNMLTTMAWATPKKRLFALEGSSFISGALIQWLRDELRIINTAPDVESLAKTVPDNGGMVIVPAFVGLGAPHWDQYARGTIVGLTRGCGRGHFARAALEAMALQTYDIMRAMERDSGITVTSLRADGGAAANNLLMQLQADILNVPVERPKTLETTALGATYLAGLAVGFWKSESEIESQWQLGRRFEPTMSQEQRTKLIHNWHRAIERSKDWEEA